MKNDHTKNLEKECKKSSGNFGDCKTTASAIVESNCVFFSSILYFEQVSRNVEQICPLNVLIFSNLHGPLNSWSRIRR